MFKENADPYFEEVYEIKIPGTSQTYKQKQYQPFAREPKSLMFGSLQPVKDGIIPIKEVMFGIDTIDMNDAKWQIGPTSREKEFVNVKSTRMISDK